MQDEKRIATELAELRTEVKNVRADMVELRKSDTQRTGELAKISTGLEGLSSRVGAVLERNRDEINTIFDLHKDLGNRFAEHVADHIPEAELRAQFQRSDDRFQRTEEAIARVNGRVNGWAGFFVAILAVIEIGKFVQGFFK